MAQTPHQQIQVVQHSNGQLQQLYFPQQQMLFPGNITLQPSGSAAPTLHSMTATRSSYPNTSVAVLPKSIQPAIPVQSATQMFNGSQQRQITTAPHITSQSPGASFHQGNIFGSFATLSPLPAGYQWTTGCYPQSPIIIRSQHPNIYVQPQSAIQLPISAGHQIIPSTNFTSNSQVHLETQTIATQTLVPSASAVNSSTTYIQVDQSVPTVTKSTTPCASPSSSTPEGSSVQNQSNQAILITSVVSQPVPDESNPVLSTQTENEITEAQPSTMDSESANADKRQLSPNPPEPSSSKVSEGTVLPNDENAYIIAVTSTTPSSVASLTHLNSFVSSIGAQPSSTTSSVSQADSQSSCDAAEPHMDDDASQIVSSEPMETIVKVDHLKPQKPISNPYRISLKEKQPQKAIVKPQMLSHVKDSPVKQGEHESFMDSLKSLSESPFIALPEEQSGFHLNEDSSRGGRPEKKLKAIRGRGRPRGRPPKAKIVARRRSLRQQSQVEIIEVIEKNARMERSARRSDGIISPPNPESSVLPAADNSELSADVSIPAPSMTEALEMKEQSSEIKMPSTTPNLWSVEEVFEFVRDFPGCVDYADSFKSQEIDGQALLLIKLDHLMTGMSMKLGPAVKLLAQIRSMKEQLP